jgi:hypothetical protein
VPIFFSPKNNYFLANYYGVKQGHSKAFECHKAPKKIPCYKRYKNSRNNLDGKANCQLWITKVWMKKLNVDENIIKIV